MSLFKFSILVLTLGVWLKIAERLSLLSISPCNSLSGAAGAGAIALVTAAAGACGAIALVGVSLTRSVAAIISSLTAAIICALI